MSDSNAKAARTVVGRVVSDKMEKSAVVMVERKVCLLYTSDAADDRT